MTEVKEGSKKKVLIIDDEEDLCVLAGYALTANRSDLEVISAKDGPSGLERAKAEQPAAIVLDINMPRMDGYEVCRRLKADSATRNIPVVMLILFVIDDQDPFLGSLLDLGHVGHPAQMGMRFSASRESLAAQEQPAASVGMRSPGISVLHAPGTARRPAPPCTRIRRR